MPSEKSMEKAQKFVAIINDDFARYELVSEATIKLIAAALDSAIAETREECAGFLAEELDAEAKRITSDSPTLKGVRMGLTLAARLVRRGRRLTASEHLANLKAFLEDDEEIRK